jgi:hypothetical protein
MRLIHIQPDRLRRGRTGSYPKRCSNPTCRSALGYAPLLVAQGSRRWAFCATDCVVSHLKLSRLADIQTDDFIEAWDAEGRP